MRVRCTASSLVIRALPGGVDIQQRLKRDQVVTAVGQSFDGGWYYIADPAGWASKNFLEEISELTHLDPRTQWIGAHADNFRRGRPNSPKIDMIVIHVIEGTLASADEWFNNPKSEVSAHYAIGLNREIHQYVREENTAYHAGRVVGETALLVKQRDVNPNYYSIGIEHEGTATSLWPNTMYEDSARLVAQIAQRQGIPLNRDHVVGHHEIYKPKSCPGMGDVNRIVQMARAIQQGV